MSTLKPGSPTSWQDCLTIQQSGSTNYCPGTGSCNSSPKQRQHNAPPEKIEPFTRGAKRMDTVIMPDGTLIVLERQPGADTGGYAGLEDEVDNHWDKLFEAAVLSTLLSVGAEAGTSQNENNLV